MGATILPYSVKVWRWKSLTNLTSAFWIIKNFPTKILHLENFGIAYFYGYNLLTWVCQVMSRHEILKYFHPITHKKHAPKDKDPPEGKE